MLKIIIRATNKLLSNTNIEYRIKNFECQGWNRFALSFYMNNNDKISYFDIHHSIFKIFFTIKPPRIRRKGNRI